MCSAPQRSFALRARRERPRGRRAAEQREDVAPAYVEHLSARMRRVGVLMTRVADDPQSRLQVAAFQQRLQELGWTNDVSIRIEYRWGAGEAGQYRKYAAELMGLASDVIVAVGGSSMEALLEVTRAVPIVLIRSTAAWLRVW